MTCCICAALILSGCHAAKTKTNPVESLNKHQSLTNKLSLEKFPVASEFQAAPTPKNFQGAIGLAFNEKTLVFSRPLGLAIMNFDNDQESIKLIDRKDANLGFISERRQGGYLVEEVEVEAATLGYLYDNEKLIVTVPNYDSMRSTFSHDGKFLFASNQANFIRIDLKKGDMWKIEREFSIDYWDIDHTFVPGTYGQIIATKTNESIDKHKTRFWNGISRADIDLPSELEDDVEHIWADNGHLYADVKGVIRDFGEIPELPKASCKLEAFEYSPWAVERLEDRKTVVVKSIFKGGVTHEFKRDEIVGQDYLLYGLYVLCLPNSGNSVFEFIDLRTGETAFRIYFNEKFGSKFVVILPDGTYCGDKAVAKSHHLKIGKHSPKAVLELLKKTLVKSSLPVTQDTNFYRFN